MTRRIIRTLQNVSERTRCRTCNEIYLRLHVQQRGLLLQRIRGAPVVWVPVRLDVREQLSVIERQRKALLLVGCRTLYSAVATCAHR